MRALIFWPALLLALAVTGAERKLDFSAVPEGQTPPGFRNAVTGSGKPGLWQVIWDDVPPLIRVFSAQPPGSTKKPVLAQVAQDPTDEHFPLFIYDGETFGDFTLTTRFKTVRGVQEQMAGIAFRVQDERNYYVVRASSLGNTFRFYKVLNGQRGPLVGPEISIPAGQWHELAVDCSGNQIRCSLNGKELVSVTDKANPLLKGKVGFWTKSDSVSYFADTSISYTPFEPASQKMVKQLLEKNPRLLDIEIFVTGDNTNSTRLVGSRDEKRLGQAGGKTEADVLNTGTKYYGKEPGKVTVVLPMRDRNGDPIAAVRIVLKPVLGQTEQNAVIRALPIVKELQNRVQSLAELVE